MIRCIRAGTMLAAIGLASLLLTDLAHAQSVPTGQPIQGPGTLSGAATKGAPGSDPGFTTQLFGSSRGTLLGDLSGVRTSLGNFGITLGLQETSEVFGNVTGGVHTGAAYDGLTLMSVGLDTEKAFGWEGGTFNASALQIHGRNLATDNLYSLQTNSGIEAERATRLWELWYEQAILDGRFDAKIGQQSIDQEFMASAYSALFINTMMGWPMVPSVDMYAGGPAYPLSSLGVRFRGQPTGNITLLGGVFDDNPPGGPFNDDDQLRGAEASGTRFNLNTGALFLGEAQYAVNQPAMGDMDYGNRRNGLPGLYKLGFWYDTAGFPDQYRGTDGLSLADANSNGTPVTHRGNFSIYAVGDQTLWQPADPEDPHRLGVFARLMGAPADQNLVTFSINTGVDFKAPIPGRDDDTLGIGYGLAKVSNKVSELQSEQGGPVQSSESFIEVTYQAQVAQWWQVQPDFQYVFTPSGGVANPNNPSKRIENEAIFGLRTNVVF